jgi:hypothetical protein
MISIVAQPVCIISQRDVTRVCIRWIVTVGLAVLTAWDTSAGSLPIAAPFGIDVTSSPYSAKGDGVTDDTEALQRAIDAVSATGGTVWLPHGVYKTSRTLKVAASNVSLVGDGAARIRFQPKEPYEVAVNDRALILGADALSERRPLAGGAVPAGAVTFRAASAKQTSDLAPGDWLIVQETDPRVDNEIVWIDWVQVGSVDGPAVRLQSPFRTTFPNNHTPATLIFQKVLRVVENIAVRDLAIEAPLTRKPVVGVAVAIVRGVLLERVTSNVANGNAFFSYRSADVSLRECRQLRTATQATEFAATMGLRLIGNTFGVVGTSISRAPANTSSLVLDYGTAFFEVVGNEVTTGGNILMQLTMGVHDGVVANNIFGWSRNSTIGEGQGIVAAGAQNLMVIGNVLIGGDGPNNTGISFAPSTNLAAQIPSQGNVIGPNIIRNYAHPYGTMLTPDAYVPVR